MVDWTARQLRRLTRQRHDLGHLFGGERRRRTRSRGVGKDIENRLTQTVGLGAFPYAQRLPGIPPTLTPNTHLDPIEADLEGDFFVQHPGETQQDDPRPLRDALANRARLAEFLQQFLLPFTNNDLR